MATTPAPLDGALLGAVEDGGERGPQLTMVHRTETEGACLAGLRRTLLPRPARAWDRRAPYSVWADHDNSPSSAVRCCSLSARCPLRCLRGFRLGLFRHRAAPLCPLTLGSGLGLPPRSS